MPFPARSRLPSPGFPAGCCLSRTAPRQLSPRQPPPSRRLPTLRLPPVHSIPAGVAFPPPSVFPRLPALPPCPAAVFLPLAFTFLSSHPAHPTRQAPQVSVPARPCPRAAREKPQQKAGNLPNGRRGTGRATSPPARRFPLQHDQFLLPGCLPRQPPQNRPPPRQAVPTEGHPTADCPQRQRDWREREKKKKKRKRKKRRKKRAPKGIPQVQEGPKGGRPFVWRKADRKSAGCFVPACTDAGCCGGKAGAAERSREKEKRKKAAERRSGNKKRGPKGPPCCGENYFFSQGIRARSLAPTCSI